MIVATLPCGTMCVKDGQGFYKTDSTVIEFIKNGEFKRKEKVDSSKFIAPIRDSYCFLDGSAFLNHIELARKARGAELPKNLYMIPLMYQGISSPLLGPNDDIRLRNFDWGLDFEAEVGVILNEVPEGVSPSEALGFIIFFCMFNDWTYRNLLSREAETGFGFIQSKPASSFAPYLVTPEELDFKDGKLKTKVQVIRNDEIYGDLDTSEMFFSFGDLISFAAKTRTLPAGTIIGSGTISNKNGFGCIAEKRAVEIIEKKINITQFLQSGEVITIRNEFFGEIRNKILA